MFASLLQRPLLHGGGGSGCCAARQFTSPQREIRGGAPARALQCRSHAGAQRRHAATATLPILQWAVGHRCFNDHCCVAAATAAVVRGVPDAGEPGPHHGTLHSRWHAGAQRWRPPFGASAAAIAAWRRWQWLLCVAGKRPCCGRARAKPYIACVATSPTGHTLKAAAPWPMEHSWNTPRLGTSVFHNDHWNTAPRCGKLNTVCTWDVL